MKYLIMILSLFFIFPFITLFAKGCYDGTKDITINTYVYDSSTNTPINDAIITLILLPSKNLMTPQSVNEPVPITQLTDIDGYASFVGQFPYGNCFDPIEHPDYGLITDFLILQAAIKVKKTGYYTKNTHIQYLYREPMLFKYDSEYSKYTSLYLVDLESVDVFIYLDSD